MYDSILLPKKREGRWSGSFKGESADKTQARLDQFKMSVRFTSDKVVNDLTDIIIHSVINKEPTFFGENPSSDSRMQCESGRRRSSEDIYRIAKTYIPEVKLSTIRKALEELVKNHIISRSYCSTTRKMVHYPWSLGTDISKVRNVLDKLNIKVNGGSNKSGRKAAKRLAARDRRSYV